MHVFGGEAARNFIMAYAASIEHGDDLDEDLLRLMEKGTFLVGTDFSFDNNYANYGTDSITAIATTNLLIDRLKRAYKLGSKMAFGTDIIIDLPGLNHVQSGLKVLETWKAAKIPSSYILQTMTINAAELLGIEKEKGV